MSKIFSRSRWQSNEKISNVKENNTTKDEEGMNTNKHNKKSNKIMETLELQISSRNAVDKAKGILTETKPMWGNGTLTHSQCEEMVHSHSIVEKSWPQHSGTLEHSHETIPKNLWARRSSQDIKCRHKKFYSM